MLLRPVDLSAGVVRPAELTHTHDGLISVTFCILPVISLLSPEARNGTAAHSGTGRRLRKTCRLTAQFTTDPSSLFLCHGVCSVRRVVNVAMWSDFVSCKVIAVRL